MFYCDVEPYKNTELSGEESNENMPKKIRVLSFRVYNALEKLQKREDHESAEIQYFIKKLTEIFDKYYIYNKNEVLTEKQLSSVLDDIEYQLSLH